MKQNPSTKRTPKQRFVSRHRTAYCKRHHDLRGMWCVFKRRDDKVALVCAFTVPKAWGSAVELL